MVDQLDTQNMISRTPIVEKLVATQREDLGQQQMQAAQFQRDRQHQAGKVKMQNEPLHVERQEDHKKKSSHPPQEAKAKSDEANSESVNINVELVQELAETPSHRLDMNV